jgi:hypothetical protein
VAERSPTRGDVLAPSAHSDRPGLPRRRATSRASMPSPPLEPYLERNGGRVGRPTRRAGRRSPRPRVNRVGARPKGFVGQTRWSGFSDTHTGASVRHPSKPVASSTAGAGGRTVDWSLHGGPYAGDRRQAGFIGFPHCATALLAGGKRSSPSTTLCERPHRGEPSRCGPVVRPAVRLRRTSDVYFPGPRPWARFFERHRPDGVSCNLAAQASVAVSMKDPDRSTASGERGWASLNVPAVRGGRGDAGPKKGGVRTPRGGTLLRRSRGSSR